ncbi:MAG: PIN domain-containing protein [Thermodesulfobacteriota bacterium]|nr:PIN domain-containing protein [Thermodesulfobacteriota bacterium]
MEGDKTFIDTNILIYAYDSTAGQKHKKASRIVSDLWDSGLGVLSTQVLQEFFVNVTAKIPKPLDVRTAKAIVNDLLTWETMVVDGPSILKGVDIHLQYQYAFWDALIIEAAIRGGSQVLLSEDLSHGQIIQGVTIRNPFRT